MTLKQNLIDGDPLAHEPELDAFHAQTMRQRVLLEARHTEREGVLEREGFSRAQWWLRPASVAVAMAICLAAGIGIGMRLKTTDVPPAYVEQDLHGRGRVQPARQLQFSSPGGTRIIWTFHQELDL